MGLFNRDRRPQGIEVPFRLKGGGELLEKVESIIVVTNDVQEAHDVALALAERIGYSDIRPIEVD